VWGGDGGGSFATHTVEVKGEVAASTPPPLPDATYPLDRARASTMRPRVLACWPRLSTTPAPSSISNSRTREEIWWNGGGDGGGRQGRMHTSDAPGTRWGWALKSPLSLPIALSCPTCHPQERTKTHTCGHGYPRTHARAHGHTFNWGGGWQGIPDSNTTPAQASKPP
jgi:hypothetical protein